MFITDNDYSVVVGEEALKVISRASESNRRSAEQEAMEEIAGYLRPEYDCNALFTAEGEARNRLVVMYAVDIALYHMVASMPQKMGIEIRKERYDRAIRWLEGVQAGKIMPDIPKPDADDGSDKVCGTVYFSEKKLRHNW